jgi:hypothetical protein
MDTHSAVHSGSLLLAMHSSAATCVLTVLRVGGEFHETTLGNCAHSTRAWTSATFRDACDTCGKETPITSAASRARSWPRKAATAARILLTTAGVVDCRDAGGVHSAELARCKSCGVDDRWPTKADANTGPLARPRACGNVRWRQGAGMHVVASFMSTPSYPCRETWRICVLCACECDLPQLKPTGQPRLHKCLHPHAECGHHQPQSRPRPHVLKGIFDMQNFPLPLSPFFDFWS